MAVRPPEGNLEEEAKQDSAAGKESSEFKRLGEVEDAKHAVKMAIHSVLLWLIPGSIIVFFILYWIGVIIYAVHLVSNGWLPEAKLHELRAVLFSGFVGAVISQGMKRFLD